MDEMEKYRNSRPRTNKKRRNTDKEKVAKFWDVWLILDIGFIITLVVLAHYS